MNSCCKTVIMMVAATLTRCFVYLRCQGPADLTVATRQPEATIRCTPLLTPGLVPQYGSP
jgi:hypothetical protein